MLVNVLIIDFEFWLVLLVFFKKSCNSGWIGVLGKWKCK